MLFPSLETGSLVAGWAPKLASWEPFLPTCLARIGRSGQHGYRDLGLVMFVPENHWKSRGTPWNPRKFDGSKQLEPSFLCILIQVHSCSSMFIFIHFHSCSLFTKPDHFGIWDLPTDWPIVFLGGALQNPWGRQRWPEHGPSTLDRQNEPSLIAISKLQSIVNVNWCYFMALLNGILDGILIQ